MKKVTFAVAAMTMALAGAASAQAPAVNPAVTPGSTKVAPVVQFSALDMNKDGKVSRDEVKAHNDLTTSFATLDADKDTYLSEVEYGKWKPSTATHPDAGKAPPNTGTNPPAPGSR